MSRRRVRPWRTARACLLVLLGLTPAGVAPARAAGPAPLVLRGGVVYTLDPARPRASALVVEGGRIAYVGDDAGATARGGPSARVVTLAGRMVLPGFHDSHAHPMSGALPLLRCRLDGRDSLAALRVAVRACVASGPRGAWLLGGGWSPQGVPVESLSRAALDELVPDRPAYLRTVDGFEAWVNTRALDEAGLGRPGAWAKVEGLRLEAKTGEPSGVVEGEANQRLRHALPRPTEAELRTALRRASAMASAAGITSILDASVTEAELEAYRAADLAGELSLRVVAAQRVDVAAGPGQLEALEARRARARGRRFRADAVKLFLDGDLDRHTAALLEPYADLPTSRGELLVEPQPLATLVRRLDAAGFLIHMHAMGDRAVRLGLDVLEEAARANGPRDRRHQLAHLGVVSPEDLPRFAKLGVAADVQPLWAQSADVASAATLAALGPSRARFMYPLGSLAAAGAVLVAGSDWPSLSLSPLESIEVGVTRQPLGGTAPPLQPEQRVGLPAILAAYTRSAAYLVREEAVDGTLEVGKAADLVILDRDLFTLAPTQLHEARVLVTLLEGEVVHRDPDLAWPE